MLNKNIALNQKKKKKKGFQREKKTGNQKREKTDEEKLCTSIFLMLFFS